MLPSTQRLPAAPLPEEIKAELDTKAKELLDILKSKYIKAPPRNPRFNYIIDVWTRGRGKTWYFGLTYACPGPTAISSSFESKFARMENTGSGRFALSYMMRNNKWFRLFLDLTVDECLDAIENDWHFQLD